MALAAYNAGPVRADEWLRDASISYDGKHLDNIPFPETRRYVSRVLSLEKIYARLYPKLFDMKEMSIKET